mmetsp:Transcript_17435/g.26473  ORF Transcript_17435/g.26473 Transcript_17435/m.26473 type:complete len:527 (+) Transcript_17435:307-1887(+)
MLSSQFFQNRDMVIDEARPNRNHHKRVFRGRVGVDTKPRLFVRQRSKHSSNKMRATTTTKPAPTQQPVTIAPLNVLTWMEKSCPMDVIPMIIAYAGPQMALSLNRTNKFWHSVFQDESTWKQMCEELYKWKEGDKEPYSWKMFYRRSPCVPIDYPTIMDALSIASDHDETTIHDASNLNPRVMEQRRSLRILLRPGEYIMREAIVVQAVGENTSLSIETMDLPKIEPIVREEEEEEEGTDMEEDPDNDTAALQEPVSPAKKLLQRAATIGKKLSCRSVNSVQDTAMLDENDMEVSNLSPVRATIVSRFRRPNEPIFRVRQGTLMLRNVAVNHFTTGIDIWNGNAAIQIQPALGPDEAPVPSASRPRAYLNQVDVYSRSGRGIVAIDGGICSITRCYVHDCAATGIYVGGPGSRALIQETDVVRNGNGSSQRRGGIGRGHSGIYLEQGCAVVRNCNISQNSLTGVSAVSQENAILNMESSDLIANGAMQLEMPPTGTPSRERSNTENSNVVAASGRSRSRSGLMEEE